MEWRSAANNLTSHRRQQVDASASSAKSRGIISVRSSTLQDFFLQRISKTKEVVKQHETISILKKRANTGDAFMHTESNLLHQGMILLLSSTFPDILSPMRCKQWKQIETVGIYSSVVTHDMFSKFWALLLYFKVDPGPGSVTS